MKKSAAALFVILTVLDVLCTTTTTETTTLKTCAIDFEGCVENIDCCSKFCPKISSRANNYCLPLSYEDINMEKTQGSQCAYYAPKDEQLYSILVDSFGLYFAVHPFFPVNSVVEVEYGDKYLNVVICDNRLQNMSSNIIMELSRDAAMVLGITEEGLVDCSLQLIPSDGDYSPIIKPVALVLLYMAVMAAIL